MRRQADQRRFYVFDYYSPRIFYAATLILVLSVVDALLTLWLIGEGAQELNPVMAYFLNLGPNMFMAAKYLLFNGFPSGSAACFIILPPALLLW